ncbi:hypothetical protein SBY92_004572 [Candida maltosa Xu316]|uniref:D-serine dehydratase n=1 Tax=Candida maltosa (strain Xu316) TaxID=1245528 RepID=M3JU76_CANMX|nr:hypothetical protein G210_3871 [Candida maltosa Xu316]
MPFPYEYNPIADKQKLVDEYVGKTISDLPTPSLIINKTKYTSNCQHMINNAKSLGVKLRVHVKTHKTYEGTELQLGQFTDRIVVSTMMEAWNIVKSDKINDIHYSLPVVRSSIPQYADFANHVEKFSLMLDDKDQVDALVAYRQKHKDVKPWSVFVKVDQGTHRAGLEVGDSELASLIAKLLDPEVKQHVQLYGFYCHAGNSYGVNSESSARDMLIDEIKQANNAAKLARKIDPDVKLILSVGATPTAHASESLTQDELIKKLDGDEIFGELELHAGNYPCCDLQQLATQCVQAKDISLTVLAEVVSTYPNRQDHTPGEQLINAGVLSLARESSAFEGFGHVVKPSGYGDWFVGKISQEHGVLYPQRDCKFFPYGTKLRIIPQHSCIAAANFPYYFIVGEDDETVVDVWVPFRAW